MNMERADLEERVRSMMASKLGIRESRIQNGMRLSDLDVDSCAMLEIAVHLEFELGVVIHDPVAFVSCTVADLIGFLHASPAVAALPKASIVRRRRRRGSVQ